jgi:hypothetical protein
MTKKAEPRLNLILDLCFLNKFESGYDVMIDVRGLIGCDAMIDEMRHPMFVRPSSQHRPLLF